MGVLESLCPSNLYGEFVVLLPCGAVRSQVDQGEETRIPQEVDYKMIHSASLNVQRCSFTNYSPVVTPKTLPPAGRSTERDTHHNRVSGPFKAWMSSWWLCFISVTSPSYSSTNLYILFALLSFHSNKSSSPLL